MKFLKIFFFGFITAVIFAQNFVYASLGMREYLPGDIVHIVIEAPVDTNRIKAIMPDGEEINLIYDGHLNIWNGYWEVPAGFKKGIYQARLAASDVEGVSFEGSSSAFYISEPVLALMMKVAPSEEVAGEERPTEKEKIAKSVEPTVINPPVKIAAKKVKPGKVARIVPKEDINVAKARLIAAARSYLAQFEYEKAKAELNALLKIEPDNKEVKTMLNRLEAVIRTREIR